MPPQLAQLIEQAQQGDVAAFERLIQAHQSKLYGFARAFTSDSSEAADLAQEALIKIYRSLGSFRYQSSLLTWMFRIVKNVFLDHHKSRRQRDRRRETPLEGATERELCSQPVGLGETAASPEAQLLLDEERRALWAALAQVPETYRAVVVLADMQGLSYEEIASAMSVPVGTVKSRLNRGRDALREVLEKRSQPR
jgi:RNA polymerase sigma-70 factor (ECF subfamily)